ncbi:MAG: hypothetical protein HOV80_34570 [Polyangiaceae bacterium]|nr:hypothetical protein [Polyangiaceae bacterium]
MLNATVTFSAGLFALSFASGCGAIAVLEEGTGGSGGGAGSTTTGTTGSKTATSTVTKSASSQTGMPNFCHAPLGSPCDPATFPICPPEDISGIPCCHAGKMCGPTGVSWEVPFCTDDCAQNCELIQNPEHCQAIPWCVLGPQGCVFAPGG